MQRLFSTFPDGSPGVGLLLLRTAAGVAAVLEGSVYLSGRSGATTGAWAVGVGAVASGTFLLLGFLTPFAGLLVASGSAAFAFGWLLPPTPNPADQRLTAFFVFIVAVAIVCLGPGARSLDCYLFGRREIVIPPDSRVVSD